VTIGAVVLTLEAIKVLVSDLVF